jgi:hypothetical protein
VSGAHAELELHPLDPSSRQRHVAAWEETQIRFVDAPDRRRIRPAGHPAFVEYVDTLAHYRNAHAIGQANQRGEVTTEQLRQTSPCSPSV